MAFLAYIALCLLSTPSIPHRLMKSISDILLIKSHNELAAKGHTIKYRPWIIVYTEEVEAKSDVIKVAYCGPTSNYFNYA
jgi:hypothetical protein